MGVLLRIIIRILSEGRQSRSCVMVLQVVTIYGLGAAHSNNIFSTCGGLWQRI